MAKNNYIYFQLTGEREFYTTAIAALQRAQELAPTDPKLFYSEALFGYLRAQEMSDDTDSSQLERLLRVSNRAIKLKPDYRDSYFIKGLILKSMNRPDEARDAFETILEYINPEDSEIQQELQEL